MLRFEPNLAKTNAKSLRYCSCTPANQPSRPGWPKNDATTLNYAVEQSSEVVLRIHPCLTKVYHSCNCHKTTFWDLSSVRLFYQQTRKTCIRVSLGQFFFRKVCIRPNCSPGATKEREGDREPGPTKKNWLWPGFFLMYRSQCARLKLSLAPYLLL